MESSCQHRPDQQPIICRRAALLWNPLHTSGKVMKPAKIATGYELSVPAFVESGDKIEIDTRTGEYRNRVK